MKASKLIERVLWGALGVPFFACGGSAPSGTESSPSESVSVVDSEIKNGSTATNNGLTVVKLWLELDGNDGVAGSSFVGNCTGYIVSRDMIVTAAHCFRTNTPTAANRWWTRNVPVAVGAQTQTSSGGYVPLTVDAAGTWIYANATVRLQAGYNGYQPAGGAWVAHTIPPDVATIKFSSSFPGFTNASQVAYIDAGGSGTTQNGTVFGYGSDGTTYDYRSGFFTCSKASGVYTCNASSSLAQGCPVDSGAPFLAGAALGVPFHYYAIFSSSNCSNVNQAAAVLDNLSFITAPVSTRCVTQTFTSQTPPPQLTKTLTKCF